MFVIDLFSGTERKIGRAAKSAAIPYALSLALCMALERDLA